MKKSSPKGIWPKTKHGYREFAQARPGERFLDSYERWNTPGQTLWVNFAFLGGGIVLIVVGVLLGLVPGVPGVVLMVLGLAVIATRFRWMAVSLDWLEVKCRKGWQYCRKTQRPINRALKNSPPLPP